jgi:hypothetical protein
MATCPECGRDPALDPPSPLLVRRAWIVPLVLLSVLVGVGVWKNAFMDWTPAPSRWHAAQMGSLDFPDQRITSEDLEAMSAGRASADVLLEFITERAGATERNIHVAFVPPAGDRLDMVRYGWPLQVVLVRTQAEYDDVFAREGVTQAYPSRSTGFRQRRWIWNAPGAGGVVRIKLLTLDSIVAMLVVLVAVWFGGRVVRDLAWVVRAARRDGRRVRDRLIRRAPVIAMCVFAVAMGVLSVVHPVRRTSSYPIPIGAPTATLGITGADLAAMPNEQRGPALARAILEASPPHTPADAECLAASIELTNARVVSYGADTWPGMLRYSVGREVEVSDAPRWQLPTYNAWQLSIERSTPGGGFWEQYEVVVPTTVMYLGAPIGIGLVWGGVVRGFEWRRRRRGDRRRTRGRCVSCGYEVGMLSAKTSTADR